MKKCISILLLLSLLLTMLVACTKDQPATAKPQKGKQDSQTLDVPLQPDNVEDKPVDMHFESAYMHLTVELLQKSAAKKQQENLLISPLSVQLALAMTANGANGKTLQEMEAVLGRDISLEDLNGYLRTYSNILPCDEKYRLQIANSIWCRDDKDSLQIREAFLQTNVNYYNAGIYARPFDKATLKEINNWASEHTDGQINKVLERIDELTMLYLINAITFDSAWDEPYKESAIWDGSFTTISGKEQKVPMMHGEESLYLEDNRITGFIKPYSEGRYTFAVLMPHEGIDLYDYIGSLTADRLSQTLAEAQGCKVVTQMPKFSYACEINMNDALAEMGMPTAFDSSEADLSRLGSSSLGNLYIGNVLHKTFIRVDGLGTQAGAVTVVEIPAEGAYPVDEEIKEVIVDRPFVYMILDGETNLPIFIGCVTEVTE